MIIALVCILTSIVHAEESIQFAAVIYRHGDRTPVDMFPTDPWRNESLWPVKFGELTNTGKQQHYALGKWLRNRYSHLLSDSFDPTEIYVRSTDVDRTLMSVQANLAGMYPPVGKSIWNPDLLWQPIPVHTVPENQDEVLAMKKYCVAYDTEMLKLKNSKDYRRRLSKYQRLMDYLTAYTGRKVKDYDDMNAIYSILEIETTNNFTLPNWTKSVFPDKLREPSCYSFKIPAATPLLGRLSAGPLIKEIVSRMARAETSKENVPKVTIYSGHDLTVATVLDALGMFDGNCPVFTAAIFIELVQDSTSISNFIRISYRNTTKIVEPQVLKIPYCGQKCSIKRFSKLYENLLTVNFDRECEKKFPALAVNAFFFGLVALGTIFFIYKVYRSKGPARREGFNFYDAEVYTAAVIRSKLSNLNDTS